MSEISEQGPKTSGTKAAKAEAGAVSLDRSERHGSTLMVLLLAAVLLGAVFFSTQLDDERRSQFILWFLAALASVGIAALFLNAIGLLQFSSRGGRNDLTKQIADTFIAGLLVTEGERRIVYANSAYQTLAGATGSVDLRTVDRLFTGPPEVSEAIYRLAQAARDGKAGTEEIRLAPPLTGEAEVGWYRVRVAPLSGGGARRSLWIVSDITHERERHENVFQELQNAVDYLDHAPAGFLSAEPSGAIVYLNATLANWLDYDIAQVGTGGLTLSDIVPGSGAALLETAMGAPGTVKTDILDLDLKRRGGQTLPVRLFHRVAHAHDGAPGPSRTLVLNRSQGEDTAEGQRAAEVRFARFFNNSPLAIATIAASGAILRTNAPFAKLFSGIFRNDTGQERNIQASIVESGRPELETLLKEAVAGKSDLQPMEVTLAGEGNRSARFIVSPVEHQDGDGEAAILYAMDTTEQRALQEQFAQANKMQAVGQLAGGVAHDFNNVLTAIIGYSDLLLANHRPTDPSFQDIMQIKQNANRAASLTRQLLAFSRRQTLRPQVLQLTDTVSDLSMLLKRLLGEKIELEVKHARDLWLVMADVNQFEQVIMNLAVNARDAMPDGGKVTIRSQNFSPDEAKQLNYQLLPQADWVMVEVEDSGTGIPPEVLDKIFEPFFTTKEVGKGTGLGLSMVYGIVKQTGGFIFCDSVVGKGTRFRIFLPRHIPIPTAEVPKVEEKAPVAQDLTGNGTILLVEDEEAVRAFGSRALRSRGYTVLEAASGVEALEVIKETDGKLDLVVSDVVMPEMDGPTLLGELRKTHPELKVIFVSGYAEEAFKKNLPEGAQFAFLPKPFSLKQLIEAVKGMMNGAGPEH